MVGAIGAVLPHPVDPLTLYVAGVGGGVWKTTDGGVTWTPQTDKQESLAINWLAFDPTDGTNNTVLAGIGRNSAFVLDGEGGQLTGILRTTDGGTTWNAVGFNELRDRNIFGVEARGNTILAVAWNNPRTGGTGGGLYRSTDGANFDFISGTSGLTAGSITTLAADPTNNNRFYVGVLNQGIFRSDDAGATWTNVTNQITGLVGANPRNIKISVGAAGATFLYVVDSTGNAATVWRSANQGVTWTQMDTPDIFPGGQGFIHGSILADATNPNLVYIGGDANGLLAIVVRGDASAAAGSQFTSIVGTGNTGSGTAPHVDSRSMRLDVNGRLIQGDDGGFYVRTTPTTAAGDWISIQSNVQTGEIHSIGYNNILNRIIAGTQDNGTVLQNAANGVVYTEVFGGDGAVVAVNDTTAGAGNSVHYYSAQFLQGGGGGTGEIIRTKFDNTGAQIGQVVASLTVGGQAFSTYTLSNNDSIQFYTPVILNNINQSRIAFGTSRIYTGTEDVTGLLAPVIALTDLNSTTGSLANPVNSIWWGHQNNANLMLVGAGSQVFLSTTSAAGSLTQLVNYAGGNVEDVIFDGTAGNSASLFVADSGNGTIWSSTNSGGAWTRRLSVPRASSLEFVNGANAVLLGGQGEGVYFAKTADLDTWFILRDATTPNADILDLDYDATDDVLVVGTLGRGAWKISGLSVAINAVPVPASIDADMIRILRPAAGTITFGGGTLQAPANTVNAANHTINAGGMTFDANGFTTTLSGVLSGAGTLTKTNTGTLILSGANTYTGATTVRSGVLNVQNATGLGTVAGSVTIQPGAELQLQGGIAVGAEALTLNGKGTAGSGGLRNIGGNNSYAGAVTMASNSRIGSDSAGETLTLTGGLTNAGFLLTVGGIGNTTFDTAAITGAGGVTKDGTGVLQYNFSNTYTGNTTVNAGTLRLGNPNVIDNNNAMTVTSPGTFDLNGNAETIGSLAGDGSTTLGAATLTTGNNNTSTTFSGIISGAGGLTKAGTGTFTLSGANTFDGATAINAGVLNAQNNLALGSAVGATTVAGGAALELQGGVSIATEALTLNGTGVGGAGALRSVSGNNAYGGAITLGSASRINADAGGLTISGNTGGANNLTIGGAANTTASGIIGTGAGTLTKDGTGTLFSTGAHTFTGQVSIDNGTMSINSIANGGVASPLGQSAAATPVLLGSAATQGLLEYTGAAAATDRQFNTGGAGGGRLDNNGGTLTLNGTVNAGNPLAFGGSGDTTLVGNLAGAGAVTKDGSSTLTYSGAKTYAGATQINAGTLDMLAASTANNSAFTVGSGGLFTGFGSVLGLTNNGRVRPGDPTTIGAIAVGGGNYVQGAGGDYAPKVGAAAVRDQIVVTGTATLSGSFSPSLFGGFVPAVGTVIQDLVTATGGVAGTFNVVNDISFVLKAEPIYNANDVDALIIRDLANPALGLDNTQRGVATSLQFADNTAPSADLTAVLDAITVLPSADAVKAAYNEIAPRKLDAVGNQTINQTRIQNGNLTTRMNNLRAGVYPRTAMFVDNTRMAWNYEGGALYDVVGIPTEGNQKGWFDIFDNDKSWGIFATGSALFGNQKPGPASQTGYEFVTVGATMGIDYKFTEDLIVGLAGGYSNTDTTVDNNGGSAQIDSISVGPYVTYQVGDFYFDAYAGYAKNIYDIDRRMIFGTIDRTANGDPGGDQVFSYLGLGYDRKIGEVITGPIASIQYTKLWIDPYTETGAGALNLTVNRQEAESFQAGMGWHWAYQLKYEDMVFLPNLAALYQHEYLNDARGISAQIAGGTSFASTTANPGRDFIRVGAGLTALVAEDVTLNVGYNTQLLDQNYIEQGVSGGVRIGF